jgi:hypothetical protein
VRAILPRAAVVAFFAAVFFYYSHPLADGDLWWHLNTGRWIVTHQKLPDSDPFTYTVTPAYESRARMSVRSNWLAQIVYYAIYRRVGMNGLRFFNAALFTLIALVLYRTLRMQGLGPWWAMLLTAPCAALAWHYDELRPLGFSILFTTLFLYWIERAQKRRSERRGWTPLALVVLTAALWANVHRGFPLMYLVLGPYALAWLWQRRYREALWLGAAALASLLNPGGVAPVVAAVAESFQGTGSFLIMELASPWQFARLEGPGSSYLPLLAIITAGTLALLAADWRRLRLEHVLLYAAFALAGWTAFRYSVYFAMVATAAAAPSAARLLESAGRARLQPLAGAATAAVVAFMIASSPRPTRRAIETRPLPLRAVSVIAEQSLPGPLLNPFSWGGYVSWALWPRYKVFLDSRLLDYSVYLKLERASEGPIAPLLNEYGINTVVYPPADLPNLRSQPIVRELMADPEWRLAFFDPTSTLFVRQAAAPAAPQARKEDLGAYLLGIASYRMQKRPAIPEDYFELAAILHGMGREGEAAQASAQGFEALKQAGRLP